ncbi:MAG: hypothetical protein HOP15_07880, partial [Planctomycetes bacterium]|nr:hypothetical protein [Planctomycetota bacterium]
VHAATVKKAARKGAEEHPKKTPVDAEELRRDLKKKGSRELIVSFAVAFVVFVVAGVVLWKVLGQKKAEQAAAEAYQDRVQDFKTKFMAFDIQEETSAKQLIAFAEEHKALANSLEDFASEVVSRVAKAKTFLEGLEQRRDLEQRLTAIEQALANAAQLAPIDLAEQRRRLDELAAKAGIGGPEFVARVARDREQAEQVYVERLVTSSQAAAAAETLDRAALATIQQGEDELFKLLDVSYKAWDKNKQDEVLITKKNEYQEKYQSLVKLSDEAVQRFYTPEVIEATPWRDLLSAEQASAWKSDAAKGYERRIENGLLHLIGPDPSEKSEIVMTIGDREVWRDYEIDMEFTIVKGQFTAYFRVPIVWQDNIWYADLKTDEGYLIPGEAYSYTFRIVASTFTEEQHSEDSPGPTVDNVSWTKPRKGAFGIGVSKDTEVKFTRLRARVLR